MQPWDTLLLIVIVLGAATLLGALFESLRQSAILGYLLAGAVLGPGGLAILQDQGPAASSPNSELLCCCLQSGSSSR